MVNAIIVPATSMEASIKSGFMLGGLCYFENLSCWVTQYTDIQYRKPLKRVLHSSRTIVYSGHCVCPLTDTESDHDSR